MVVKRRSTGGQVVVKFHAAHPWSNGGKMVVKWWSNGRRMLVKWWLEGGQVVVKYKFHAAHPRPQHRGDSAVK